MYRRKRLVSSLPENHYGERFMWCLGCSTHMWIVGGGASGAGEGEREKEKGPFSLISPVGVVAGATSTPLGNRRRSPESSGGSEAPPHLFFTWRSSWGSELLGCALLLGRYDVAVQDNLFCQQPVASRRQMDVVFVREGAYFTCFFSERVVRSCEDAKDVSHSEVGCF